MREAFARIADVVALALEMTATVIIAAGAAGALLALVRNRLTRMPTLGRRDAWVRLGGWLLLGLEFELAADIVRTAIAPTWTALGQLAAIAVIRTFLSFFLERDLERAGGVERRARPTAA